MDEVIPHWLTKQAFLSPNDLAIETKTGEQITFLQLEQRSKQFAQKLAKQGITTGDRVGIYSSNCPSMIVVLHALSYLGAVAVLLNTRLMKSELNYQLTDAKASHLLASDSLYEHVEAMNFTVPVYSFSHIKKLTVKDVALTTELHLDHTFTIIYTSGTTGKPKGVVLTYGNHWWSAIGSALNLGLQATDKWLAVLPLFHVGGLSICIRSVIYGMPVYLLEKFSETAVNEAIIDRGVTIASVVTVMLQRLILDLEGKSYPTSFRCMLLGGGPVPKPLLEATKEKNIPVFQSYGLTETASQIVTLSPKDAFEKLGSAGRPLFPGQLKIQQQSIADQIGEICVKGPMVTTGYVNHDAANRYSFENGWFATGDLGYVDEEGFLYVVDRRNDLIISGGENIYPSEIESVLSGMNAIKEVGITGKRDDTWGEIPVAFIVLNDENTTIETIKTYAERLLASFKVPKKYYIVSELPRTASNKLLRSELKKWLH